MTTEREGVRSHGAFALTSTQQAITVPISEDDIPNVFVSVLLVKGRTEATRRDDGSDPGKPAFRLGYVELKVEDASKRLTVTVKANKDEYPPGQHRARRREREAMPRASRRSSEVTLWAVDYGVLSLTAFRTPDVLRSVYVPKALQVITTDNRQRIVSRRVLIPKGDGRGRWRRRGARRRHAAQGLPRAGVLARIRRHRCHRPGDRRREASGVADDLSDHGGGRRQALAVWIGRERNPHQQAGDPEAGVPALPRASAIGPRSAPSSRASCARRATRSSPSAASIRRCFSSQGALKQTRVDCRRWIDRGALRRASALGDRQGSLQMTARLSG